MVTGLIVFIVLLIGFTFFKLSRNKKLPSNTYTPYDEIMYGVTEQPLEAPVEDTKHVRNYTAE
ncbi:hypothetical protein [Ectobacillus panaciterrae]|uniref:hypothetical protein n=1 Tax=Ectobacillus panaciterrae TaxID=363872 RepID=UPI0004228048|nr:hypothetical protein [Ectobacillus panaciterrae]